MDRIGSLPDEVISHILSFLPTKYAVGSSILCKRWTDLWTYVPVLDFDDSILLCPEMDRDPYHYVYEVPLNFTKFVDKVISHNRSPNLLKFKLHFDTDFEQDWPLISSWIENAMLRVIFELDLVIFVRDGPNSFTYLPIWPSESLCVLKICTAYGISMPHPDCFPNLRMVDVTIVHFDHDRDMTGLLFDSLPSLEMLSLAVDTTIFRGDPIFFRIGRLGLKSVSVDLGSSDCGAARIVIDSPHLDYLFILGDCLPSYMVLHRPALSEVTIEIRKDVVNNEIDYLGRLVKLLADICNTKSIRLHGCTMPNLFSAPAGCLPVFRLLKKLDVVVCPRLWNLFLHLLHSSPNLEFLVVKEVEDEKFRFTAAENNWTAPKSLPSCLSVHLKEVEITKEGTLGDDKLSKYLVENAKALKKITFDSRNSM